MSEVLIIIDVILTSVFISVGIMLLILTAIAKGSIHRQKQHIAVLDSQIERVKKLKEEADKRRENKNVT